MTLPMKSAANFRLRNFARKRNKETWLLMTRASMRSLTGSIGFRRGSNRTASRSPQSRGAR